MNGGSAASLESSRECVLENPPTDSVTGKLVTSPSCEDGALGILGILGTLGGPARGPTVRPLARRIESLIPPRFSLGRGASKSGSGVCCIGGGAEMFSGTACDECARNDKAVNQI